MPKPFLVLSRMTLMAGAASSLLAEGTLALATPARVASGTALDLEVLIIGAAPDSGIAWTIALLPELPAVGGPTRVLSGAGSRIPFVAPVLSRDGIVEIVASAGSATVIRQIRVAAAGAEAASRPKRARSADGPDPGLQPGSINLDTLPSVLHGHIHSFDTVAATGKASRALSTLAHANAKELTITHPGPQVDLFGRIASSPGLKKIRLKQMTGLSGHKIVEALDARPGLTHLDLDETCALTPDELAALGRTHPHLTHLKVQARHVTTAALLSGFTGLRDLELAGGGPELDLRGLVNLWRLKKQGWSLPSIDVDGTKLPESLGILDLSGCAIGSGRLPAGIRDLHLSDCLGPVSLNGLTRLRTLVLNNHLEWGYFRLEDVVRANPGLTELATNSQVGKALIDSLPPGMTRLRFSGANLTAPLDLTRFPNLESLEMVDAGFFRAELLPGSLRRLTLRGCRNVDWSFLAAIPLTHLELFSAKPFKFEGLNPALTQLVVEETEGATVTRMQRALPALIRLRTLTFTLFKGQNDVDPACFLAHPTLQRAETRRNKGSVTRIWDRPGAPDSPPPASSSFTFFQEEGPPFSPGVARRSSH